METGHNNIFIQVNELEIHLFNLSTAYVQKVSSVFNYFCHFEALIVISGTPDNIRHWKETNAILRPVSITYATYGECLY